MDFLETIVLGIIQGLTEFLPVSSSGHLELAKAIFGGEVVGEESMMTTVVLHFATALSTVVVFRKDVAEIFSGLFKFKNNEAFNFSMKIILSMIPAALVGFFLDDVIETFFDRQILLVGSMLILTGGLLFLADRAKKTNQNVSYPKALIIGISQAIAILPGISRSGATIGTSVLLGIDREKAARFSFLMVVPLILGKMAKDVLDGAFSGDSVPFLELSVGFIAAFLTGLIACTWMITLVKRSKLKWFAFYCFIAGIIAIVWAIV
jgi:undecaprenyl-diphosphatase